MRKNNSFYWVQLWNENWTIAKWNEQINFWELHKGLVRDENLLHVHEEEIKPPKKETITKETITKEMIEKEFGHEIGVFKLELTYNGNECIKVDIKVTPISQIKSIPITISTKS